MTSPSIPIRFPKKQQVSFKIENWLPWLVPTLLLLIWQFSVQWGLVNARFLPSPLDVVQASWKLTLSGELPQNVWVSLGRALKAFAVGGGIGFGLGLLNGSLRMSEWLFDSSLQMLRNIPNLALIPLVILWFGIGDEAKLVLMSLGVFFPMYINTFYGIRSVDPGLVEMGRVYGLKPWQIFRHILLPGALPSILVGVRFALGIMWLTLIVAETIAADSGIGFMATNAREFMRTDVVMLSVLLYALFGKLADLITKWLEWVLLPWHPNQWKGRST
jgi:sulfonate transport system permease protein